MIHESYGLLPYKEILFSTMSKEGENNKKKKKNSQGIHIPQSINHKVNEFQIHLESNHETLVFMIAILCKV